MVLWFILSEDPAVRTRLTECLETILNKAQEPPKSKKIQHGNAKNAVLNEAINLIIHMDSDPNLLVRACNQLGQFLQHRETNLRYTILDLYNVKKFFMLWVIFRFLISWIGNFSILIDLKLIRILFWFSKLLNTCRCFLLKFSLIKPF